MNLRWFFIIFSLSFATLSACSVYKSSGRKAFESKASGNLQAASTGVHSASAEDICWSQPAADPLWHVDSQSSLIVSKLNEDEIQVCFQAP